jgi:agmatine deiminase
MSTIWRASWRRGHSPFPSGRPDDPNAAVYEDARRRQRRSGSGSSEIPSPGRVERDGEIIPASYMNFYIGNAAVVCALRRGQ